MVRRTVMKKIILILAVIILTGCTSIDNISYDEIISEIVSSKYEIYNENRSGYKYYTPSNISSNDTIDYNEILEDDSYRYYFYVDVVSYYNRVIESYEVDNNAFYSKAINYQDKFGYIEINEVSNNKYLLEIMYNYAKIEVIVDKYDLPKAISNSLIILSSVKYNSEILETIVGENILTSKEIEFNIFETKKTESNFLEVEANNIYVEEENDPDLIN